jgi:AcrR family transcriptional regulator
MASRRVGSETSQTRVTLLDSAERLMLDQGYAAVTYRKVAAKAGVTVGLVHYYFPSLNGFFIALLRRRSDRNLEVLLEALEKRPDEPLRVVWAFNRDETSAALMIEFQALANHRKSIRAEITEVTRRARKVQLEALAVRWPQYGAATAVLGTGLSPAEMLFFLATIPKMLLLEESLGISAAHPEVLRRVESYLNAMEPKRVEQKPSNDRPVRKAAGQGRPAARPAR